MTLPFLEWDALRSVFTLSQICGRNPTNALTDETEMSVCDHSLQNHLGLNYITDSWRHRQRWHCLNQHCAVGEDGWLPFSVSSVYDWGWVRTQKQTPNTLSRVKWIFQYTERENVNLLLNSMIIFSQFCVDSLFICYLSDYDMLKAYRPLSRL